ncbi:unnamed protein product [Vicia faba]|uniref:BHLH domain-containing protein n=1 Tax=Vicia faba TaxID=3906 RepID=A0AAV0YYI3_VICFA|nr:unnamed protein product [Vicia faba]
MAEEFQAGICGETWWNINNSTRSVFPLKINSSSSSSSCSGSYSNWQNEFLGLKETNNNFDVSDCSLSFLDSPKPQLSVNGTGSTSSMFFDLSSPNSSNWNHSILSENNFESVIQEESTKNFSSTMEQEFCIDHHQSLNSVTSTGLSSYPIGSLDSYAEALNDIRAGVLASSQSQYQSHNFHDNNFSSSNTLLNKLKREKSPEAKSSSEVGVKRQRIETPSPLPTFKVRKEKLGDRITALQQLVSPFGKTDTASVLHEAIDYIKFLHDQVHVLSTPYMKNGSPIQHQQGSDNVKELERKKQDLRSQGLCLVPISSTFPMTNETSVDFWTPTFGGTLFGR